MKQYIFFGVGNNADFLHEIIPSQRIAFAVDSNIELQGKKWNGLDVCSFPKCRSRIRGKEECYEFLITPTRHQDIIEFLREYGIYNYTTIDEFLKEYMLSEYMNGQCAGKYSNEQKIKLLRDSQHPCYPVVPHYVYHIVEILCGSTLQVPSNYCLLENTDLFLLHGMVPSIPRLRCLIEAQQRHIPCFFVEDGYLSSIVPVEYPYEEEFRRRHATVLGSDNVLLNAKAPSDLERLLNSNFSLSPSQLKRAKNLIVKIRKNYLSKYNHQPIRKLQLKDSDKTKVLVIDQLCGDKSIEFGNADESTFHQMLQAAIDENPNADIFIKAHPVKNRGHFSFAQDYDNVTFLYDDINPICLLEDMDKVYVCSSQMGFEAAFCEKEVHVFGMPFYAGWGITKDRQACLRRKKYRTVEEVFYATYILSTIYVSYKTNNVCEIEQVIDELLELRTRFHNRYNLD